MKALGVQVAKVFASLSRSHPLVCVDNCLCYFLRNYYSSAFQNQQKKNGSCHWHAFGQMALSNYLIQSLVFVPYFLLTNKFKTVPPSEGFILFIIVFSLQLVFSTWWMARYTMGPFEWVLRSFTYWKWQPINRTSKEELRRLRLTTAAML